MGRSEASVGEDAPLVRLACRAVANPPASKERTAGAENFAARRLESPRRNESRLIRRSARLSYGQIKALCDAEKP